MKRIKIPETFNGDGVKHNQPKLFYLSKRRTVSMSLSFPVVTYSDILTVTYYDDYVWTNNVAAQFRTFDNSFNTHFAVADNVNYPYPQAVQEGTATRGLVTGTITKALNDPMAMVSTSFYDDKGRVIQVKSENYKGGCDIATTQYNWVGQPLMMVQKLEKPGTGAQTSMVLTKMMYDDLGRVTQVDKKVQNTLVNSNALPVNYTTIVKNEYNAQGQLLNKKVGNKPSAPGSALSKLAHEYNIRGFLTSINKTYINNNNNDEYFGMELGYDRNASLGTFTPQYTGNVSGMIWKSEGDQSKRKYDFTYDAASRLTAGNFTQYVSGSGTGAVFNTSEGIDFSATGLTYDFNGNITAMQQKGLTLGTSPVIDNLTYTYKANTSNQLAKVADASVVTTMNVGDFKNAANVDDDYSYDVNGNLTLDKNKSISSITYNHLNLPAVVTVTGKGTITYTYDAAGNKLKKVSVDNTVAGKTITKTTLYIAGQVYESKLTAPADPSDYTEVLQFMGHEEGRIRFTPIVGANPAKFSYDYFIKDHLGNVRMVLTEETLTDAYIPATMETASAATEEAIYSNLSSTRVAKPSSYPNTPSGNAQVAKVTAASGQQKIGPAILLKVMAGDKFIIQANSWWSSGSTPGTPESPLNDIAAALSTALSGASGGKFASGDFSGSGLPGAAVNSFLFTQTELTGRPKAYLNWILLNEQFKFESTGSGSQQVGTSGTLTPHMQPTTDVTKNGYLYIYVSNETPNIDVFFDMLQVSHIHGPILEETHYYPFGLTMAGISSQALGKLTNRIRFNGYEQQSKEFADGSGLEWYDYKNRFYDNQVGRFFCVDRLADKFPYYTPYQFAGNEVPNAIDLDGLEPYRYTRPDQMLQQGAGDIAAAIAKTIDRVQNFVHAALELSSPSSTPGISNINTVEVKASAGTNVSSFVSYVKSNNTAEGFSGNVFNFDASLKFNSGQKNEKSAGGTTITSTNLMDGTNKLKVEGPSLLTPFANVSLTTTTNADNETSSVKAELSTKDGPVKAKVYIQQNFKENNTTVGADAEIKNKNTKATIGVGVSF